MAIDHVSIGVADVARAQVFYDAVLAPLGLKPVMPVTVPGMGLVSIGYGATPDAPVFWVGRPHNGQPPSQGNGVHIAFRAPDRAAVDAFYLAAMDRGGVDDGRPGLRHEYHPHYYGAFVRDPNGNKIEACCHTPE